MAEGGEDPRRCGPYQLVELIGEGAMARVYRAVRSGAMGFRKEVALKQIPGETDRKRRLLKALVNEARLGGHLRHRNLVEVYEFDQDGDTYYLAMEYVRGRTLADVLALSPDGLPAEITAQIAVQICAGLAHAHDAVDEDGEPLQLVHRDLKPSNVMIEHGGVVKVVDFGIAKARTNLFLTTPGTVKGAPIYMSPEQVLNKPLDRRSDLFAMGSLLVEMLTGRPAFEGEVLADVVGDITDGRSEGAVERVRSRAPGFEPIVVRAMQSDPDDRYPTAADMAADIREAYGPIPEVAEIGRWMDSLGGESNGPPPDGDAAVRETRVERRPGVPAAIPDDLPDLSPAVRTRSSRWWSWPLIAALVIGGALVVWLAWTRLVS